MHRLSCCVVVMLGLFPGRLSAQETKGAAVAGRRFACADYSQGKVFIVSAVGRVEWEHAAPSCNDLWALPDGHMLFTTGHGVMEVDREKKVVFRYESASEIYACQRLADGNTFIGECTSGRLIEAAPSGKVVKELRLLPPGNTGGHLFMRNARRLDDGHYLVCHYGDQEVREYDAEGRVVAAIAAPGGPHSAVRLPDGHTLIACGDAAGAPARVFEADQIGKAVWEIKGNDLPGIQLRFMGGLHRLSNGNTVMSNWLGHGHLGEGPHVIEVAPDKRVVWAFTDHTTFKTVASVQVMDDDEGMPTKALH